MMGQEQRKRCLPCAACPDETLGLIVQSIGQVPSIMRAGLVVLQQIPFPVVLSAIGKTVEQVEATLVWQIITEIGDNRTSLLLCANSWVLLRSPLYQTETHIASLPCPVDSRRK